MSDDVKMMPIAEFRELGFLQEANRQFFHPLGLALEVLVDDDGSAQLGGIWDYREDPEGVLFGADILDPARAERVACERQHHVAHRVQLMGSVVQPLDWTPPPGLITHG